MTLLDPRVWAGALLLVVLAYGGGRWQQSRHDRSAFDAERNKIALAQAQAQIKAVDEARLEEQRRTAAQMEATNAALAQAETARADARAAGAASQRLRDRVSAIIREHAGSDNSGASGRSKAAGDPLVLLADVLGRADKRAGQLAQYADAARIAGKACESSYDALMPAGSNKP